jgi:predicted tellurium resistance membrane protein TerC
VDSISAIFAITADSFLVFTSNVFAILGLRSIYFALGEMLEKFRFLKVPLALVLMVMGVKMPIANWLKELLDGPCVPTSGETFLTWKLLTRAEEYARRDDVHERRESAGS